MANSSVLGAIVELYRYTGTVRYLDLACDTVRVWDHEVGPKIISTLLTTGSMRKVANGKAYEMISCVMGFLDLYGEVSHGASGVSCCTSGIPRGIALISAVAFGTRKVYPR